MVVVNPAIRSVLAAGERRQRLALPLIFDIHRIMTLKQGAGVLAARARRFRIAAFRLMVSGGPVSAGDLALKPALPRPTRSSPLKQLKRAGLVDTIREGGVICHRVTFRAFRQLLEFVSEDCCQGQPELCVPIPERSASSQQRR